MESRLRVQPYISITVMIVIIVIMVIMIMIMIVRMILIVMIIEVSERDNPMLFMRNLLGWLETRLAQATLTYLSITYVD